MSKIPVYGLVLAGGFSRRMGCDKALLDYHGVPQGRWTGKLLEEVCERVYYSCREGQDLGPGPDLSELRIHDREEGMGPIGGILLAHEKHPDTAWLVLACDLPRLNRETLQQLLDARDKEQIVTAFKSAHDGLPEPLGAIYEPTAFTPLKEAFEGGLKCPRRFLINSQNVLLVDLFDKTALDNANTPEEADAIRQKH
jgi:molybdopterin-guanine dinucleotide biosynthesis protein A